MNLTRIKVRGKRTSSAVLVPRPQKRTKQADGRPSRRPVRRAKKYSIILREPPLEVLERIYIFSQNLDFPKCSPYIERLLSGRSTRINMVIAAFHPTWDRFFGASLQELMNSAPGLSNIAAGFGQEGTGDPKFQTAVLECEWAKIDIILEAQKNWYRMYGKGRWYSHAKVQVESRKDYVVPSLEHSMVEEGFGHFNATDCFEYDFERYGSPGSAIPETCPRQFIDVHAHTRIPDSLISGPWTPEMMKRLFWLRRGGSRMTESSHTWEVKLEAFKNAAVDARLKGGFIDIRLLRMLLSSDDFAEGAWPEEVRCRIYRIVRKYVNPSMNRVRIPFLKGVSESLWYFKTHPIDGLSDERPDYS